MGRLYRNHRPAHRDDARPAIAAPTQCDAGIRFPSPWIARFDSESDFNQSQAAMHRYKDAFSAIDDQMLASRHPRNYPAYCSACGSVQPMRIDWRIGAITAEGSVHPSWTETGVCQECGLNSRMRAVLHFVLGHADYRPDARCYLAERVTVSHPIYSQRFATLEASEYLGHDIAPGTSVFVPHAAAMVRHEDLTRLTYADESFDWVITQDVFEHIPDYRAAFGECARVLAPGGQLVFTVPFHGGLSRTQVRAIIKEDGSVEHLLPKEVHGNPVSGEGALCFQNFGWNILDALRAAGFARASAHAYWGVSGALQARYFGGEVEKPDFCQRAVGSLKQGARGDGSRGG